MRTLFPVKPNSSSDLTLNALHLPTLCWWKTSLTRNVTSNTHVFTTSTKGPSLKLQKKTKNHISVTISCHFVLCYTIEP